MATRHRLQYAIAIAFVFPHYGFAQSTAGDAAKAVALDPIVVTATRSPQRLSTLLADVTVIGPDEIARAGQSTLADLLARQPAVEISTNGGPATTTAVFLRGANNAQTLVLIDGVRVTSSTNGAAAYEAIPLDQIERVEILRGPASALYGADAIGGVIQVFTKRGDQGGARFNANAGYGTYDTGKISGGVSGSSGPFSYALQLGGARSNGFNAIWNPSNFSYNPDSDGYKNWNVSASGSWRVNEDNELSAQYLRSRLNAQFDSGIGFDDRTITVVETYSVASRNRFTPEWTSWFQAAVGVNDSDSETGFGDSNFNTRQRQLTWQNDITLPVGSLQLLVGRLEEQVTSTVAFAVTERTTNSAGAFYQLRSGPHTAEANVRYDHSSQFGGRTTGSLAYGYRFDALWRVTASAGTAFKAPTFNDLYFPGFSNPDLSPESSRNIEAGVYYGAGDSLARLVIYHNRVNDLIVFVCDPNFVCAPQNLARATLRGITLGYERVWEEMSLRASLDLQDPEDDTTGNLLPRRARRHGTLVLARNLGPWRFGLEQTASSLRYDDPANTRKLGGYTLTNLTVEYEIAKAWTLFARFNNIFNKHYELAADYNVPGANAFAGVRFQQ